jgi:putative hydrolase of the HAD superfamily
VTILVLDVDGVVVLGHPDGGRWDKHLLADLGIAPDDLQMKFFRPRWQPVVLGRADLLSTLGGMWHELESRVTPRAFVDYWFANDSRVDQELLTVVNAWRAAGNKAYLATVQEHHRAKYLWETMGLRSHFDGMHHSAALGAAKPDRAFYERSHAMLQVQPDEEVLFLDDSIRNIEAAAAFGWRARHYTNVGALRSALDELR